MERVFNVAEGIHHWWTKPMPPLVPPAVPKLASLPVAKTVSAEPVIPPFDIQDIPEAMDKLKLPVSAAMMRHWFEGAPRRLVWKPTITPVDGSWTMGRN